jgi:hypothetical protein
MLSFVVLLATAGPAAAAPITYAFSGTFTDVTSNMESWLPGLSGGGFDGTVVLDLNSTGPAMRADVKVAAGNHSVTGWSTGLNPLAGGAFVSMGAFAQDLQNGYVDALRMAFDPTGFSTGMLGIWVMAKSSTGSVQAGHAVGTISSFVAVPEPATAVLYLMGVGALLVGRHRYFRPLAAHGRR